MNVRNTGSFEIEARTAGDAPSVRVVRGGGEPGAVGPPGPPGAQGIPGPPRILDVLDNESQLPAPATATQGDAYVVRTDLSNLPGIGAPGAEFVTSLPATNLTDGREVYLQTGEMADRDLIWHLRYKSAAAAPYRWQALGALPVVATTPDWIDFGTGTGGVTATYPELPYATAPRPGLYMAEWWANAWLGTDSGAQMYLFGLRTGSPFAEEGGSVLATGNANPELGVHLHARWMIVIPDPGASLMLAVMTQGPLDFSGVDMSGVSIQPLKLG